MSYRTLLLPLFDEEDVRGVVDVATGLAPDAHLIGLHVVPSPAAYGYDGLGMAASFGAMWLTERHRTADRIRTAFDACVQGRGGGAEWHLVDGPTEAVERCVNEMGNAADAVVLAREEPPGVGVSRHGITARVLLGSGRPALVVPHGHPPGQVGRRVFAGWDAGAASTRALWGALPVLRAAETVRIHRVEPARAPCGEGVPAPLEALAAALGRHGVRVQITSSRASSRELGEEVLGLAGEWRADLVVVGAYGHGPVRGFVLGDTTRHLLEHARVPLLTSH